MLQAAKVTAAKHSKIKFCFIFSLSLQSLNLRVVSKSTAMLIKGFHVSQTVSTTSQIIESN